MEEKLKGLGGVVAAIIIAVVFIIALASSANHPYSSEGVITVSDYEATISKGDTLVITSGSGKSFVIWSVTYDGDKTVTATPGKGEYLEHAYQADVCGVDCVQKFALGWFRHLTITEQPDSRVNVKWTFGWQYYRYKIPNDN